MALAKMANMRRNALTSWVAGTPEHALLVLVLLELAILVGLRNVFRTAHGG